ncbi:MAG TPA: IS66 family insertion sequence hypothetical protein [Alphaproteobacteria bacterium]|nr:IS66 family insertion sequence hypothetical protein [Alphaproteobacteria bacterium]
MRVLSDGRVRRSEAEWRAVLDRYEASGLSESAFCRRAKLPRSSFVKWKRRLAGGARSSPAFVEWLPPAPAPAEPAAERTRAEGGEFELQLPGGVALRWRA